MRYKIISSCFHHLVPDLVPEQARALASPRERLHEQLPPGPHAAHDVSRPSIRIHGTRAHDGRILPSDGWILQLPLDAVGHRKPQQQYSVTAAFQSRAHETAGDDDAIIFPPAVCASHYDTRTYDNVVCRVTIPVQDVTDTEYDVNHVTCDVITTKQELFAVVRQSEVRITIDTVAFLLNVHV